MFTEEILVQLAPESSSLRESLQEKGLFSTATDNNRSRKTYVFLLSAIHMSVSSNTLAFHLFSNKLHLEQNRQFAWLTMRENR